MRTEHEVARGSNLDLILRAANGIGNRLVDAVNAVGGGLQAIALALATPQDNSSDVQAHIDKLASQVEKQSDALEEASNNVKES